MGEEVAAVTVGEGIRLLTLVALTVVLIALCAALAFPLLAAITWAVALAILAWPMHRLIARRVSWPSLAAGLSSAIVVVAILGTTIFVTYQIARETGSAVEQSGGSLVGAEIKAKAIEIPYLGRAIDWMERAGVDLEQEARRLISAQTSSVTGLAQGSVDAIIQFLVMVFILYYLLRDHRQFREGLRGLLPLTQRESDLILAHAGDSIHANLYATFVTSVIDSIGFGLIFWWFGLPAPVLWTLVMLFLSLLPVLGAGMVWAPTVAYLGLTGQWSPAIALLAWGIFTFILVDNALYAHLAGARMRMHEVLALVAFLGGLALFGISGIIVGPVIMAVTIGALEVWKGRKQPAG